MWKNTYKDYKPNAPFSHHRAETGKSIVGCEMQERYGWGEAPPASPHKKRGWLSLILGLLFKRN